MMLKMLHNRRLFLLKKERCEGDPGTAVNLTESPTSALHCWQKCSRLHTSGSS